ncbi:L-aminopeptidase/D-esterase-like protein [Rhizobium sp. SG_E_25_P2]|uniref:P1 family peptidase n=1 Tax=Rhizobium sp. SG_E_25_P2 TaxID=2879942 RepID=UPI002475EFD3|nr:P1 family peptidase [Rhizobium sp. SG_E_25_P2]MDH6268971.1 L-aminopeptidase/D-esterase-like protein [Rhizobium sp. SG_E_25_P2]
MKAGPRNLLTDVAGLTVGHVTDPRLKSGVTAILCDPPAVAAAHVMGGAPGTRETDLLEPHNTVQTVDAITLSGGSAFGLDAASGVQSALREMGRGFAVGSVRVPIVPAAILFDLLNGGDKDWERHSPYRNLGYEAALAASAEFELGSVGAGAGALTAGLKGGLGSASAVLPNGFTVGALAAVNALGSATFGATPYFRAATFEIEDEFGGLGLPPHLPEDAARIFTKMDLGQPKDANTTIAVIATDAILTKAEAKRLAMAAHDGFAHALWPSHTPFDGDIVFALATGASGRRPEPMDFVALSAAAAAVMARAIARGVYSAQAEDGDLLPVWTDRARA